MTASRKKRTFYLVGVVATVGIAVAVVAAALLTALGADGRDVPAGSDYVDIEHVPLPETAATEPGPDASRGTYTSPCGRNDEGHNNWDNVITSPDERDGAQHLHEYVGNTATDAFATDERLAHADTSCSNGDASTYYWPTLRSLEESGGPSERFGNDGRVLRPDSVVIQYRGSTSSDVVPMPRFLRLVTGDAKAVTNEAPAWIPQWGCTDVETLHTSLYPLCPGGRVVRTFDFPSCWDGRRIDSPDHRSHVTFPAANGVCPPAMFPIPQLRLQISYTVPPGRSYAIDTFPEQHRSPTTDHADFVNVMPEALMDRVTTCINLGRPC